MMTKTWKAKIKLQRETGGIEVQDVTVQANDLFKAKLMLESQYGKGCIISGPLEVRP